MCACSYSSSGCSNWAYLVSDALLVSHYLLVTIMRALAIDRTSTFFSFEQKNKAEKITPSYVHSETPAADPGTSKRA